MDRDLKIKESSHISKEMFISEQELKIKSIIDILIEFRLNPDIEYKEQIRNFFKTIRKTSQTLSYTQLFKVSEYYEIYMNSSKDIEEDCHDFFSNVLKGIGIIKKEVEVLKIKIDKEKLHKNKDESNNNDIGLNKKNKEKILILDDDKLTLSILRDGFESEGYSVITTTNPYEAIEHTLSKNINIILIDIIMPKLNGFEVFEILKNNKIDIPIIFLTGKSLTDYKVDALSKGADDYITKPFEIKEVVARVERALIRASQYKSRLNIDKLTGAHTKEFFTEKIEEFKKNNQLLEDFSVAFMDIDDFKFINDTYGHIVGDYILKDFTKFMENNIEEDDLIFRFGGDEFIILFYNKSQMDAFNHMENIREQLAERVFKYKEVEDKIKISISIGVTSGNNKDEVEEILDRADKCLYKSKELGKNRTICCDNIQNCSVHNKKILLSKKESDTTNLIKKRLKYQGYKVDTVYNQSQLKEVIPQTKHNLFVLDLTMRGLDPIDICKEIKNHNSSTKIMIITSQEQKEVIKECIQIGVEEYITKPFCINELEKRANALIN